MRSISTEGFEKPKSISAGAAQMPQWLKITDLIVDPAYQLHIVGNGVTQTINSYLHAHRHHEPVARAPASNSLSNSVSFAR
jgi:hypothetical protein